MRIYLFGGPSHGRVLEVDEERAGWGEPIRTPYISREARAMRWDSTATGPAMPWADDMLIRSAEYRKRRWSCGNFVYTTDGAMVFDFCGSR